MPKRNIFESEQALHKAFVEHCNKCDCPLGCIYRRDARFLLETQCASILKCFARFVIDNKDAQKGGEE